MVNTSGTFGKVCLSLHKPSKTYHAMKILSLREMIALEQVDHLRSEKKLLARVSHPMVTSLTWWTRDSHHLYLLCPYVPGGELFSYLRCYTRFPLDTATFYLAEVTAALSYLHSLDIIYRDLKPENILLDREGHIVITDLGFSKQLSPGLRTWTVCGTAEYMAPELVLDLGHTSCVDWWSLGVLAYELTTGHPPFPVTGPGLAGHTAMLLGRIEWPGDMEDMVRDFIQRLLVRECSKRLGHGRDGSQEVKDHKLFLALDWDEVEDRKLQPPIIPKVTHAGDTRNFEQVAEPSWDRRELTKEEIVMFEDF